MNLARKAVTCGLALGLALGSAPVVALADPASELASAEVRMEALGGELSSLEAQLEAVTTELESTDNQIARIEDDIAATEAKLTEARQVLSRRMRSGYKAGSSLGMLEFLLGSKSIEDFVSRVYYMDKVNESDARAISEVRQLEDQLVTERDTLEEQRRSQEERVLAAEAQVAEYQQLAAEASSYYFALDAEVQAQLAAVPADEATGSNVAAAVQAAQGSAPSDAGGGAASEGEGDAAGPTAGESGADAGSDIDNSSNWADDGGSGSSSDDGGSLGGAESGGLYPGGGVSSAYAALGWPYVWGGYGPWSGGFDCSGLVSYCYGDGSWRAGCERLAYAIQGAGLWTSDMGSLSYGDLVFTDSEYNHVGIYVGDGQMIHAPRPGRVVSVDYVWSFYGGGPFVTP